MNNYVYFFLFFFNYYKLVFNSFLIFNSTWFEWFISLLFWIHFFILLGAYSICPKSQLGLINHLKSYGQEILPKNWVIVIEFSMKDGQFIFNLPTQMKMGRLNGRIFNRKRINFFDSIKIFIIQIFQPFCDNEEI